MSGRARGAAALPVAALILTAVATAAIWRHPSALAGSYDWRYFESTMEVARRSIAWFGQTPLYNPWMCGGEPQLANPQSVAGSPAFLFIVLFGTAIGARLMLMLFVAVGLDGAFRLGRELGLQQEGAGAAALSFGLSGWVMQHFGIGHVSFFGATLIPHLLFFYLRARRDLRYAVAVGAIAALIVAQGGTSTAAMAAIALGGVAVADAIATRELQPLVVLALSAVAAIALGAYRLLPALEFAIDHPRHVVETDGQTPLELLRTAFVWNASGKPFGHRYGLHEYAWRLPLLAWPLAVLGLVALVRRPSPLRGVVLALVLLGGGIALGEAWPYGPWWLMRRLPVLRDLRVPSRYVLLAALGVSLIAGAGLDQLVRKLGARAAILLGTTAVGLLAIDGAIYGNAQLAHVFELGAPKIERADFYQVKGHYSRMLELVYQDHGVIGCDEEAPLTRALSLDEGPGPQARLEEEGAGSLKVLRWSPNEIELEVSTVRPTNLLLNLNWNEHWKSDLGEVVRVGAKWPADKDGGRLGVRLPVASGRVRVLYRPRSFVIGTILTALSLLFIALVQLGGRPSARATSR